MSLLHLTCRLTEGMKSGLVRGAGNISPSGKLLSILYKTYVNDVYIYIIIRHGIKYSRHY